MSMIERKNMGGQLSEHWDRAAIERTSEKAREVILRIEQREQERKTNELRKVIEEISPSRY